MAPHLVPAHPLDDEQEYTVQVHIWLSAATSANYKGPKKRLDRRDKATPSFEDGRKLREKSSWATTLPRGSTAGGHWRPATCRLREEEGEICNLSIYLDDLVLFKTIKVHRLHHTDIRPADVSLFSKRNCLAIDVFDQQQHERVYLLFPDPEICSSWLCLIRAFSTFELYGRWANPEDGGLYRLWRQLELTVIQARNLGQPPPSTSQAQAGAALSNLNGRDQATDSDQENMSPDVDIFCEVWLNGLLCGRTSARKESIGGREWHETFLFPDLPPFDKLEVVVWQQQETGKTGKSEALGKVKIPLATFRRGEAVDGRYPVLKSGSVAGDLRVGEMRLKIKVDEEIVMPLSVYRPLLEMIRERNFLEWLLDLEQNYGVKTVAPSLIAVVLCHNNLIDEIIEYATEEIPNALMTSKQTIFRSNDVFTKTMETCLGHYGRAFLEASVGPVVRRICNENIAIEVDPIRITSKNSARGIEKGTEALVYWSSEFWNQIYASRNECPNELRILFEHIRLTIARSSQEDLDPMLNWQGVSAFCFLRFIVPAILHPQLWGLWSGMPSLPVQRTLKLISKVIQGLANLNEATFKEDFMQGMRIFIVDRMSAMEDYLRVISTPIPTYNNFYNQSLSSSARDRDEHTKMVARVVHRRRLRIPNLGRESIPTLPHLFDLPRHLALITSTILHSPDSAKKGIPPPVSQLADLIARCCRVEEEAKSRVKDLARATTSSKPSSPLARPPLTVTSNLPSPTMVTAPPPPSQRGGKGKRPSTAPASDSDSDASRKRLEFVSNHMPAAQYNALEEKEFSRQKRRHVARTASTESFIVHSTSSTIGVQLSKSRSAMPLDETKRKKGFRLAGWFSGSSK